MIKRTLLILMPFAMMLNAQVYKQSLALDLKQDLQRSIDFFKPAYDSIAGVYYSELSYDGKIISEKIHTVALSRMIYGLSYSSQFNIKNIAIAKKCVQYQLNHMLDKVGVDLYFVPEVENTKAPIVSSLDVWQQAYGLCGLTEYYRVSKDSIVRNKIQQLHSAFCTRFRDSINGGFYGNYVIGEGPVKGSKSIQSLMYPLTAYIINLWEADEQNRSSYETILKENIEIAYNRVWNDSLEWVNVKFDDKWNAQYTNQENAFVTVGHNFQFAALLLRASKWSFIVPLDQKKYRTLGEKVVDVTLKKSIWHNGIIAEGFYAGFNPLSNKLKDNNRTWWQHSEAVIALSLCNSKYKSELEALINFYFKNFIDTTYGGEIFNITDKGEPVIEPKGQKGKSIYHHTEMLRFLIEANS